MKGKKGFTRRSFVKGSAAAVTASLVVRQGLASPGGSQAGATEEVPHRPLGKTGALVSCLGVAGITLAPSRREGVIGAGGASAGCRRQFFR